MDVLHLVGCGGDEMFGNEEIFRSRLRTHEFCGIILMVWEFLGRVGLHVTANASAGASIVGQIELRLENARSRIGRRCIYHIAL